MSEKFRRIRDYLGPYDYRAGFIYFSILMFSLPIVRVYSFQYEMGLARLKFFLIGALTYAILGLPLYVALKLSHTFWKSRSKSFLSYVTEIMLVSMISLIAQVTGKKYLAPLFNAEDFLQSGKFLGELIFRIIFGIFFVAFTHNYQRSLEEKLESISATNKLLKAKYSSLIDADEEIRTHASRLLHDRIQSKLMLAGAKLTRISGLLSEEGKLGIHPVIKELEQIRSIEVREVSQLLTPNLAGEGLIGSCENLCSEYEPEINFHIDISQEIEELGAEIKLGLFRIVEQAVINSIKHGPAKNVRISLKVSSEGHLEMEISDDGPGGKLISSGTGTVVIDAWVSKLEGRKEIETAPGLGYTLLVLIP